MSCTRYASDWSVILVAVHGAVAVCATMDVTQKGLLSGGKREAKAAPSKWQPQQIHDIDMKRSRSEGSPNWQPKYS